MPVVAATVAATIAAKAAAAKAAAAAAAKAAAAKAATAGAAKGAGAAAGKGLGSASTQRAAAGLLSGRRNRGGRSSSAPAQQAPQSTAPASVPRPSTKPQGSEGAPVKPDTAERLRNFAEMMAQPSAKPGESYTRADRVGDAFRDMAESAQDAAEAGGTNIPGMQGQTWEQFDALAKARGMRY